MEQENINYLWANLLLREFQLQGCKHAFISPGSRNSPLSLEAAKLFEENAVVCMDERAAAFAALASSKVSGFPALLICTSGTAAANYTPAVIEAFVDNVPLIVCSADRPPQLHHSSANQTVDQSKLFEGFIAKRFLLPTADAKIADQYVSQIAATAFQTSLLHSQPVHCNVPFNEPLAPQKNPSDQKSPLAGPKTETQQVNLIDTNFKKAQSTITIPTKYIDFVSWADELQNLCQGRGIILFGRDSFKADIKHSISGKSIDKTIWGPQDAYQFISQLCHKIPVYCDASSGIPDDIKSLDLPGILASQKALPQVDWVLHFGGPFIDKTISSWVKSLAALDEKSHNINDCFKYVQINQNAQTADPSLSRHFKIHCNLLQIMESYNRDCSGGYLATKNLKLDNLLPENPDHLFWTKFNGLVQQCKDVHFLSEWNEVSAVKCLASSIPAETPSYVANSLSIRHWQQINPDKRQNLYTNRGVSGIEGSLASAFGLSLAAKVPTLCLTGDVSLIHDLSSLTLIAQSNNPILCVVLNNSGGNIFQYLPIKDIPQAQLNKLFVTSHQFQFGQLAQSLGIKTVQVRSIPELEQAVVSWKQNLLIECLFESGAIAQKNVEYKEKLIHLD